MASEWTPESKRMMLTGLAAVAILVILLFGLSLLQNRGPSRCEGIMISEAKDDCWRMVAKETGDSAYCNNISTTQLHDQCVAALMQGGHGSSEMCAQLNETMSRDLCYSSLAGSSGNATYCSLIRTSVVKDSCYSSAAASTNSPALCNSISNSTLRVQCSNGIYLQLAIDRTDASLCRSMVASEMLSYSALVDNCILQVAANSTDKSMCSGISNETLRAQCSAGPLDYSSCEGMADSNARNVCFYTVAVNSGNPDDCTRVPGSSLRDNCYYQFAIALRDPSLCANIVGENLRSVCRTGTGG